jgi:hypothetical protein
VILACGFLHAGTVLLQRVYVLFVMGIQARTVRILGVTAHPARAWTTRQARNLLLDLGERAGRFRFLGRGRDSRFTGAFGEVFAGNGTRMIKTPVRSPRVNPVMEQWVPTCRRELLDRTLQWNSGIFFTLCVSSSSSMIPTGLIRNREMPGHCVHCPHQILATDVAAPFAYTGATVSAVPSTSTDMPLDQHG